MMEKNPDSTSEEGRWIDAFVNRRAEPVQNTDVRTSWLELAELDTAELPMLWDGLLPSNEIALLAGIGGYGKSTLVRQLAIAITRGDSEFLGQRIAAPHRRVIYVACEDGKRKTAQILKQYGGVPQGGLVFVWASQRTLDEVIEILEIETQYAPADLIVIDSLGNIFERDQNSNSDAQLFYARFAQFAEESLVLFLHHIRKGGHRSLPDQANIQGAGAFVQRARAVLMLTGDKHSTERYLHMEKENDVSDTFKYEALVLDFDRSQKRYSSSGRTKPTQDFGSSDGKDSREIDFTQLFREGEKELRTGELVDRIRSEYGVGERTAKDRLSKSGLRGQRGRYSKPM